MVCFRHVIVNTIHKGGGGGGDDNNNDDEDDDDDDDNSDISHILMTPSHTQNLTFHFSS
jgi:hypothetical protein